MSKETGSDLLLGTEFRGRYLMYYVGLPGVQGLKAGILLGYVIGIGGALLATVVRQHHGYEFLLVLLGVHGVLLGLGDNQKFPHYFIHVFPVGLAVVAAWLVRIWRSHARLRPVFAAFMVAFLALQLGGVAYKFRLNTSLHLYTPVVAWLNANTVEGDAVTGNAELIFGLKPGIHLTDGIRLASYERRKPEFIVLHREFGWSKVYEEERYRLEFENADYRVYGLRR